MKEKTIWHPASEFPESGAYVLVVYNGRLREQTVNQKIMADFFETATAITQWRSDISIRLGARRSTGGPIYPA